MDRSVRAVDGEVLESGGQERREPGLGHFTAGHFKIPVLDLALAAELLDLKTVMVCSIVEVSTEPAFLGSWKPIAAIVPPAAGKSRKMVPPPASRQCVASSWPMLVSPQNSPEPILKPIVFWRTG
jgi:hypothetical protein